jgi:hypothetical protein
MSQMPPLPPTSGAPGPSGSSQDVIPPSQAKDPILMTVLALFWVGYFFYGQWQKGLAAIGLAVVLFVLSVITCGIGTFLFLPATVVIMVDTYLQSESLKKGFSLGQWTFFQQHL